jgi:N-methylhydantoinase A
MGYRIGVDTGGTFTDIVMLDESDGHLHRAKVPSVPASPDQAVLNGLAKIESDTGVKAESLSGFIHGTTVATNTLLEGKGANTALLVTRGFRDVLHIVRQDRPSLYHFKVHRPPPLVRRRFRIEVSERLDGHGNVLEPLNEDEVRKVAAEIRRLGITSVAICFLHAYANPKHEHRAAEILRELVPDVEMSLSSDILPEIKEYERMSTTVVNAFVRPVVSRYLSRLEDGLRDSGVTCPVHVMQSNGGLMTFRTAQENCVHTILSGPAGGALSAARLAERAGLPNAITIDMGGTSADVAVSLGGELNYTTETEISGHAIQVPAIEIHTVGAGGGSIAWIDRGGLLQVGPQSAGADPGPACYGRGGTEATVTDANLVLGRLDSRGLLGGGMAIDLEVSRKTVEERVSRPLGLSIEEAATGILRIVNATMVRGIRYLSVEKGHDPRDFALIAFGGCGPLHVADLARELDIPHVLIPPAPGVNSAVGLLMADLRRDYVRTLLIDLHHLEDTDLSGVEEAFGEIEGHARHQMEEEGISPESAVYSRSVDLRYHGQGSSLNIPFSHNGTNPSGAFRTAVQEFHERYKEAYGYQRSDYPVQLVNVRVVAIGEIEKADFQKEPPDSKGDLSRALVERRPVWFEEPVDTPVYDRDRLRPGDRLSGPAIIEQLDSTTLVLPRDEAEVDSYGILHLHINNS